jgi:hypothetical protein
VAGLVLGNVAHPSLRGCFRKPGRRPALQELMEGFDANKDDLAKTIKSTNEDK